MMIAIAEAKKEDKKSKSIEIDIPNNYDLQGKKEGDVIEALVELKIKGNKFCVVSLDGIPLGDYTEEEKITETPEPNFETAVEEGMTPKEG